MNTTPDETIPDPTLDDKSCGCLPKIRDELQKVHGENSDVCLELKLVMDMNPDESEWKTRLALPPLYYTFRNNKKKRIKAHLAFNFCPFCGKEMK